MALAERAPRVPGVRRYWQIPDDLFHEPAEEADLDAAEGGATDTLETHGLPIEARKRSEAPSARYLTIDLAGRTSG